MAKLGWKEGTNDTMCTMKDCARFLARGSTTYCTLHATSRRSKDTSSHIDHDCDEMPLFLLSYELWLRSKVGANLTEGDATAHVLNAENYFTFCRQSQLLRSRNCLAYLESMVADYRAVNNFLENVRMRDQISADKSVEIINSLELLVKFRKFHLPVKGTTLNPFQATDLLLAEYLVFAIAHIQKPDWVNVPVNVLHEQNIQSCDLFVAVNYHLPQFDSVIRVLQNNLDFQGGLDCSDHLEFATSFLCLLLQSRAKRSLSCGIVPVHEARITSFALTSCKNGKTQAADITLSDSSRIMFTEKDYSILREYMEEVHTRTRLTPGSQLLLTDTRGRQLNEKDVKHRIALLVYSSSKITPMF